jgi:hypothetical protein
MPEGEKHWGGPVVIGGDNLPSPVQIGLTDLQNIGGASGHPGPPGSGTTAVQEGGNRNPPAPYTPQWLTLLLDPHF